MNTTTKSNAEGVRNSHRFQHLNEGQRQQAIKLVSADGRPNCIGLRFTLDNMGNVDGFRDEMPRVPHCTKTAMLLKQLSEAILATKTSERGNRVWMDTRDWCGEIKRLALEAQTLLATP